MVCKELFKLYEKIYTFVTNNFIVLFNGCSTVFYGIRVKNKFCC